MQNLKKIFLPGYILLSLITLGFVAVSSIQASASTMYIHDSSGNLGTVDTDSGSATVIGNMGAVMTDIAFDPDGNLFGITFNSLYKIDPVTGSSSLIGSHGVSTGNGLVFGSDGTLYASGNTTSNIYTLDTGTGANTSLGNSGFTSAGDLAFVGDDLFLSAANGQLVLIDLSDLSNSSAVGSFGVANVFGIATDENASLFAVAGTSLYSVDENTGATSGGVSFSGQGLGQAFGQAFFAESGANPDKDPNDGAVPLPAGLPLLLSGLVGFGLLSRRKKVS